jgi:TolA-binding protein
MTGEEMERAIEFLLQNQATLEQRVEQTQAQLSQVVESISELNRVVQMQSTSQGELNEMLTRTMTSLAEAQAKTEAKVDRLAGAVEKLVERLSP